MIYYAIKGGCEAIASELNNFARDHSIEANIIQCTDGVVVSLSEDTNCMIDGKIVSFEQYFRINNITDRYAQTEETRRLRGLYSQASSPGEMLKLMYSDGLFNTGLKPTISLR